SGPTASEISVRPSLMSSEQRRLPKPRDTIRISGLAGATRRSRCIRRRSRGCTRTTLSWRQSSTALQPTARRRQPDHQAGGTRKQHPREESVPTYIMLANWTDQGAQKVKDSPRRLDTAKKALFDMGGEFKSVYMTMGEYDLIAIYEAPDDAVVARFTLVL